MTVDPAADRAARRAAQTIFDRPLVIEAGAGTGKTATLVARVLVWCLGPGWQRAADELKGRPSDLERPATTADRRIAGRVLRRVVAITFTEAAAAEMAERIADSLESVAKGSLPIGVDPGSMLKDSRQRAQRARALRDSVNELQVTTIHGFCLRLLAEHPFELGLPPKLEVDADGALVAIHAERVVADALPSLYGEPGDEAALALAAAGIGPPALAAALVALAEAGARDADLSRDPFAEAPRRALIGRFRDAALALLRLTESRLDRSRRTPNAERLVGALRRIDLITGEAEMPSIQALKSTAAEHLPQPLVAHLRRWSSGSFNRGEAECFAVRGPKIRDAATRLLPILEHVRSLDPPRLSDARKVLQPLYRALRHSLVADGIVGFADLTSQAAALLAGNRPLATSLRASIDQLLVDEFQDTDPHQCAVVASLGLEGPTGARPGLFVVGDPKQSIYGWRGADLAAYEDFVTRVESAGGQRLPLVVNFRSAPPILAEVGRLLAPVMRHTPKVQPPFVPLVACQARRSDLGFARGDWQSVEHWIAWTAAPNERQRGRDATQAEAAALAADLIDLGRDGVRWHDVALLARTTTDLEPYLRALRDAGVPHIVGRDRHYYRRREVIDAAATVRAVLAPADTVALVAWLRSPAVGVPDAVLLPLWRHGLPEHIARLDGPDAAARAELRARIDAAVAEAPKGLLGLDALADWPAALEHAVESLAALRSAFDRLPTSRFLDRLRSWLLIDAAHGARHLGRYRLTLLDRFFADLAADLESAAGDRHAAVRRLRRRTAAAPDEAPPRHSQTGEAGNAVRVMTIHAAKGLQFPHVYLLQTHKSSAPDRPRAIEWDAPAVAGQAAEYRLFGVPTPGWDISLARRRAASRAELVRTLYVATTRAEDRLVIAGAPPLAPPTPEAARTHADLIALRDGAAPSPNVLLEALRNGPDRIVEDGVGWLLCARRRGTRAENGIEEVAPASSISLANGAADRVAIDPATLVAREDHLRQTAAAYMLRPLRIGAAKLGETRYTTARDSDPRPSPTDSDGRELALASGTLVHWALETFDLEAKDPVAELTARCQCLDAAAAAPGFDSRAARAAASLLARFADGPLFPRFNALRSRVVARELAVLLPPGLAADEASHQPVGYVAGAIDLVYRTPSGSYVIVDYKTDRIAPDEPPGQHAPGQHHDPGQRYAAQGRAYSRALAGALGLETPPRVEFWYLASGKLVSIDDWTTLAEIP